MPKKVTKKRPRDEDMNFPPQRRGARKRYENVVFRQETIYDQYREQLGIKRLSIDSSKYEPIDSESLKEKKGRRVKPSQADSNRLFTFHHGFEICRNRDPSVMMFLKPCPNGRSPRGWCRKYWWDNKKPISWIESGGRIMCYSKKHQEVMESVNNVLRLSLKDEGNVVHVFKKNEEQQKCLQLNFKHQKYRDVRVFLSDQVYLFSNDDSTCKFTEHSKAIIPPPDFSLTNSNIAITKSDKNCYRKTLSVLLPSSSRHRLYDPRLLSELEGHQRLRQHCASVQNDLNDCLQQLENIEGVWIQRTNSIPLSHVQ